ncbi:hypothetical protein C8J57DRAFT_672053 [Mycena rebaudengoi]|nr:hypothetical protein C8J57DRAFT_672053 [Mycena rebaudengoi]
MGLDVNQLEQQTGRPVMSSWGTPSTRRIGPADGIIVAPATVNTINKLALDIRDNYAAALLGQAVAARIPMVILPSIKKVDTERVIFRNHIENLRREGVSILLGGPTGIEPTNASSKDGPLPPFPWHLAVSAMALRFPAETGLSTSWHLIGKIGMSLSTVAFASAAIFLMQSKM